MHRDEFTLGTFPLGTELGPAFFVHFQALEKLRLQVTTWTDVAWVTEYIPTLRVCHMRDIFTYHRRPAGIGSTALTDLVVLDLILRSPR